MIPLIWAVAGSAGLCIIAYVAVVVHADRGNP